MPKSYNNFVRIDEEVLNVIVLLVRCRELFIASYVNRNLSHDVDDLIKTGSVLCRKLHQYHQYSSIHILSRRLFDFDGTSHLENELGASKCDSDFERRRLDECVAHTHQSREALNEWLEL
jgi:hypothetical protein